MTKDHINPAHHKNVVAGMQYVEVMEHVLKPPITISETLRAHGVPKEVITEVEAQQYIGLIRGNAFKYALRMGKKDDPAQEAGKAAWYSSELHRFMSKLNEENKKGS